MLLVALAAAVAACGPFDDAPADAAAPAPHELAIDLITIDGLRDHVAWLADDAREGRMTGTPGHEAAAQYVANYFAELGMEPGGEDGTWFQHVPLISYRIDNESTSVITHRDGVDSTLAYRDDYTMSGDEAREETSVRGEVVYVGYGVHAPELGYSDYNGIDVDGKIVALFRGAPAAFPHNERAFYASSRTKAEEAVRRGAVGSIGLRSRKSQESFPWERAKKLTGTRPGMAWINLSGEVADYFPKLRGAVTISAATATGLFEGTPISFEEALDTIEESRPASTPLGFEMTIARSTEHERITSPNVVGIVRGTDPDLATEYVVFSGHLDHLGVGVEENGDGIYNGAYDNAMGIGLLLEAARAFAESPPRRSILLIAVTGEERGLLGSDYFAHYPTVPTDSMVANVNLDMPLFLYPVADVVAFGAEHSSLEAVVAAAITGDGFTLSPDPIPEETIFIRSDQYSFVRKGIPATYLIPGFLSLDPDIDAAEVNKDHRLNHYHRPSDDLGRPVDWGSALRFARANTRIGYAIADADERPTWTDGDFFGEKFGN
jgi:hypothetical protein